MKIKVIFFDVQTQFQITIKKKSKNSYLIIAIFYCSYYTGRKNKQWSLPQTDLYEVELQKKESQVGGESCKHLGATMDANLTWSRI